jgi:hypothetical protein
VGHDPGFVYARVSLCIWFIALLHLKQMHWEYLATQNRIIYYCIPNTTPAQFQTGTTPQPHALRAGHILGLRDSAAPCLHAVGALSNVVIVKPVIIKVGFSLERHVQN